MGLKGKSRGKLRFLNRLLIILNKVLDSLKSPIRFIEITFLREDMEIEKGISRFMPVTITLESQLEVDALASLFNYAPIANALNLVGEMSFGDDISRELTKVGGGSVVEYFEIIKKSIKDSIKKYDEAQGN